jgi:hypothetical protein
MADNLTKKPIYIETDYDNVVLIDPNKVVVNNEIKDRLVDHEELVFYANLETRVIPRSKLAFGESFDSPVFNTTVASVKGKVSDPSTVINFLQPLDRSRFDTSWSDQITGKGSTLGLGANQISEKVSNVNGNLRFERNVNNYSDTQLLGIKSIDVSIQGGQGSSIFVPTVDISLVDVQGRTLFEQGEKSIYSVFFNQPYPLFYLTLKGYYGKAIRYELNLTKFSAKFDQESGNYDIQLSLMGKLTGLLSDTLLDYAKTAPKMFPTTIQTVESAVAGTNQKVTSVNSSIGLEKLEEVYKIYESKGLIAKNFPRLTIEEFVMRCDNFNTAMQENIKKGDFAVLNDVQSYKDVVEELKKTIYTDILPRYLDTSNYIIYNNEIYYSFKNNLDFDTRERVKTDIDVEIKGAVENLKKNASFGENGEYYIGSEKFENQYIDVKLSSSMILTEFLYTNLTNNDYSKTLSAKIGRPPTEDELTLYKTQITKDFELTAQRLNTATGLLENTTPILFKYGETQIGSTTYVTDSFLWSIDKILATLKTKEEEINQTFSEQLAIQLIEDNAGLGFVPTIRNVMAIIFAGVDTFYRLMDKTHTEAWNKKNDPKRISSIVPPDKNFGIDSKNIVNYSGQLNDNNLVYPWPTYFTLEKQTDGRQLYTVQYLADPKFATATNAFNYSIWPEIFFTEEYLDAAVRKTPLTNRNGYINPTELNNYASCNTMEFPFTTIPYENPSEISFFYEWYERLYLTSHYTNLFIGDYKTKQVDKFIADLEASNISRGLMDNPTLKEKFKINKFNFTTLTDYLRTISSNGAGESWVKLERDLYATDYINSLVEKDYGLYSLDTIDGKSISLDTAVPLIEDFKSYLESTETSKKTYLDLLPFVASYNFETSYNDTTKAMIFLDDKKSIARLNETSNGTKLTFYGFYDKFVFKNANNNIFVTPSTNVPIVDRSTLKTYFEETSNYTNVDRLTQNDFTYIDYSGNVTENQFTTLINTPLFINSLLNGVQKEKDGNTNPYVTLGYIYLSSFLQKELNGNITDYDYIDVLNLYGSLSKFSAINQIPYNWMLYLGGIWHRYKTWIDNGVDILDDAWTDFNYKKYYDPLTENISKTYDIKNYTGGSIQFSAYISNIIPNTTTTLDIFNVGFYPKVINDIHWYLTKNDLFTNYDETEFSNAYNTGKLKIGRGTESSGSLKNGLDKVIVNSYFQYLTFDKDPLVDKSNKIYVPIPSLGALPINQSVLECANITNDLTQQIKDNPSVYNGSARSLWGLSNFGYFNLQKFKKPLPEEYIKGWLSASYYYSIQEIFALFKTEILDDFENAFLGFCNPNATSSDLLILQGERTSPNYVDTNKIKNIDKRRLKDQILNIFKVNADGVTINNLEDQDSKSIAKSQTSNFSKKAEEFLKFDCLIKIGNPKNFNRKVFNSFSNDPIYQPVDKLNFDPYVPNSLPSSALTTPLIVSKVNYPEEWKTLQKYVGFSYYKNVEYTDSGSTITDFFIDLNVAFTVDNIKTLCQIIKIYAKEKYLALRDGTAWSKEIFYNGFNSFLASQNAIFSDMILEVSSYLNKNLPSVSVTVDPTKSKLEGNVTKLSTYNTFQAFNDRWIAGSDLTTKTLFEDFLFQDSSNSDIGDMLQVDVMEVANALKLQNNISILDIVGEVMRICGDTLFFAMPAYINFYGNNSPLKGGEPKNLDIPNSLFGTYTEVDYLESRPKFLIVYVGKPSEHPQQKDNAFVLYGDDSYDLRNPSTNPVRVTTSTPYNFSLSNKLVAFNVDFGIRNQNMFKSVSVGMDDKKVTAATFLAREQMANGVNGNQVAQQTTSMYSMYQSMSYTCSVSSLGNVMLQPMMYFNLRHVPLFYGPYLIDKVKHTITADNFETTIDGTRMPKYALAMPDKLATYVKINYLEKYKQDILSTKNPATVVTDVNTSLDPGASVGTTQAPEEVCLDLVSSTYRTLPFVGLVRNPITYSEFADLINSVPSIDKNIKVTLFTLALTRTSNGFEGNMFQTINNNIFEISAVNVFPTYSGFSSLVCATVTDYNVPLFSFNYVAEGVFILLKYYEPFVNFINELKDLNDGITDQEKYEKAIAQIIITTWDTTVAFGDNTASPPVAPYTAQQVKDFVLVNVQNNNILSATYDSYINACKIAFTYFQ